MTPARCSCGFTELADESITDHLQRVFEPPDATGNDGLLHEERDPLTCACGHVAATAEELDAHFLAVFTPGDLTAFDGVQHAPR